MAGNLADSPETLLPPLGYEVLLQQGGIRFWEQKITLAACTEWPPRVAKA